MDKDKDQIETLVSDIKSQVAESIDKKMENVPDEDAIRSMVQEELQKQAAKDSPKDGANTPGAPTIAKFAEATKFDNLSFKELAFGHHILAKAAGQPLRKGNHGTIEGPSKDMTFALAARAYHEASDESVKVPTRDQMRKQRVPEGAEDLKSYAAEYTVRHKTFPQDMIKANELEHTDNTGFGEEWVGVAYSSTLWEEIELMAPIMPMVPTIEIPQGYNAVVIPIEGAPPIFYSMEEATAAANPGYTTLTARTSRLGTTNVRAETHKIGAATTWSGEITEDLVVMFAPILMAAIAEEAGHTYDSMIINGDTVATTANINSTSQRSDVDHVRPEFLVNGFRKISLQSTGRSADARAASSSAVEANPNLGGNTAEVLTNVLQGAQLFGQAGAEGLDTTKVSIIGNVGFDFRVRADAEVKNKDYRFYTLNGDKVASIHGYNYIPSVDYARIRGVGTLLNANRKMLATGLVSDTAASNIVNAFSMVRWDQWYWVRKRMMQSHVEYVPRADAYELTCMTRVGLTSRPGLESRAITVRNILD